MIGLVAMLGYTEDFGGPKRVRSLVVLGEHEAI